MFKLRKIVRLLSQVESTTYPGGGSTSHGMQKLDGNVEGVEYGMCIVAQDSGVTPQQLDSKSYFQPKWQNRKFRGIQVGKKTTSTIEGYQNDQLSQQRYIFSNEIQSNKELVGKKQIEKLYEGMGLKRKGENMSIGIGKSQRVSKGWGSGFKSCTGSLSEWGSGMQNSLDKDDLQEVLVQNDEA